MAFPSWSQHSGLSCRIQRRKQQNKQPEQPEKMCLLSVFPVIGGRFPTKEKWPPKTSHSCHWPNWAICSGGWESTKEITVVDNSSLPHLVQGQAAPGSLPGPPDPHLPEGLWLMIQPGSGGHPSRAPRPGFAFSLGYCSPTWVPVLDCLCQPTHSLAALNVLSHPCYRR